MAQQRMLGVFNQRRVCRVGQHLRDRLGESQPAIRGDLDSGPPPPAFFMTPSICLSNSSRRLPAAFSLSDSLSPASNSGGNSRSSSIRSSSKPRISRSSAWDSVSSSASIGRLCSRVHAALSVSDLPAQLFSAKTGRHLFPPWPHASGCHRHLLSAASLLKHPRARFRRHLEKSQFAAPALPHRRTVRHRE